MTGEIISDMIADTPLETTDDAVLGGRLVLRQPKRGHRVGHDAILLAAATGGADGEHAVDFGAGVGGAGLALARRIRGLHVTLIEIDVQLATLAAGNAERNALADRVRAIACDVTDLHALDAAGVRPGSVDRVLMNPPFNDPLRQTSSPDARRRLAHVSDDGLLRRWLASAASVLKPGGVVTIIWRAEAMGDVIEAMREGFGDIAVQPVLPRPDATAIRVLVRATKGSGPSRRDYAGISLNRPEGGPSEAAEAVLRQMGALAMAAD